MRAGAAVAAPLSATTTTAAASAARRSALNSPASWPYFRHVVRQSLSRALSRAPSRARILLPPTTFAPVDPDMTIAPADSMVLLEDVKLTLASDAGPVNVLRG